jgi:hypothetical protein
MAVGVDVPAAFLLADTRFVIRLPLADPCLAASFTKDCNRFCVVALLGLVEARARSKALASFAKSVPLNVSDTDRSWRIARLLMARCPEDVACRLTFATSASLQSPRLTLRTNVLRGNYSEEVWIECRCASGFLWSASQEQGTVDRSCGLLLLLTHSFGQPAYALPARRRTANRAIAAFIVRLPKRLPPYHTGRAFMMRVQPCVDPLGTCCSPAH